MDNATNISTLGLPRDLHFSNSHNLWFGIVGFISNGLSMGLVFCSRGLRSHQKMSILSLALNDMLFMVSVTIYGLLPVVGQLDLVLKLCWGLLYLTLATHTVSYATISQITITCYLAVYRPVYFQTFTSKSRTLITAVCVWVASWIFVLVCIRFDLPIKEKGCSMYVVVSRVGWISWVTVPIICAILVAVANIKILLYLHRRKNVKSTRVVPRETACDPGVRRSRDDSRATVSPNHSSNPNLEVLPPCSIEENVSDDLPEMASLELVGVCNYSSTNRSDNSCFSKQSIEELQMPTNAAVHHKEAFTEAESFEIGRPEPDHYQRSGAYHLQVPGAVRVVKNKSRNVFTVTRSSSGENFNVSVHNPPATQTIVTTGNQGGNVFSGTCNSRENVFALVNHNASSRSRQTQDSRRRSNNRLPRAIVTLILLTLSSCFLSLPEVILCLVLGVWPADVEDIADSNVAKLSKLFTGINVLLNPVLYCWRLIDWASLRSRVISRWRAVLLVND